jgi:endonuclease/exonuclease/phosphatase family metal-dependent hydrolase
MRRVTAWAGAISRYLAYQAKAPAVPKISCGKLPLDERFLLDHCLGKNERCKNRHAECDAAENKNLSDHEPFPMHLK